MLNLDAFWFSGGSRSVNHIGDISSWFDLDVDRLVTRSGNVIPISINHGHRNFKLIREITLVTMSNDMLDF